METKFVEQVGQETAKLGPAVARKDVEFQETVFGPVGEERPNPSVVCEMGFGETAARIAPSRACTFSGVASTAASKCSKHPSRVIAQLCNVCQSVLAG
jgi:hypothetical protein